MYSLIITASLLWLLAGETMALGPLRRRQSECKKRDYPAASPVPVVSPAPVAPPAPVGGNNGLYDLNPNGPNTGNTNNSTTQPALNTGGTCGGFKNVVFNTYAAKNTGFPSTTWTNLVGAGVANWIGFSLRSISTKPSYDNIATTPALDGAQIPLMMDINDVDDAFTWLTGSNPPPIMGMFNEPDFSFQGLTLTLDTTQAGQALAKFFDKPHSKTKILSPAPADLKWLTQFQERFPQYFQSENGINVISIHAYHWDVDVIVNYIIETHGVFPNHPIWVTELSPAKPGCSLTPDQVIVWMQQVYTRLKALGYVEKIFWNCGEEGISEPGAEGCNPSLTTLDGQLTPLGKAYAALC